jgi:uncharacterized membrane protein
MRSQQVKAFRKLSPAKITGSLLLLVLSVTGCYADKEELLYPGSLQAINCSTVPASFSADVQPLISSKCAIPACHDASAAGGVILQTYTQVSSKKDRIHVRAVVEKSMPSSGALLPAEIAKIKCWIDAGALNN